MTTSFYVPRDSIYGGRVFFPESERRHAAAALRKEVDDEVIVVDGEGGWYRVRLDQAGQQKMIGRIVEEKRDVGEPSYQLTIGLSLLKQRNRFETFLEKAVELGVTTIIPLRSERTQKTGFRMDRAERILIAGLKQTARTRKPLLQEPIPLTKLSFAKGEGITIICHEQENTVSLGDALDEWKHGVSLTVLVGPEGGFTDGELETIEESGGVAVSLGSRRLRAETAAIYVASAVSFYVNSST